MTDTKMNEEADGVQWLLGCNDDGQWFAVCRIESVDGEFTKGPFATEEEAADACLDMSRVMDEAVDAMRAAR